MGVYMEEMGLCRTCGGGGTVCDEFGDETRCKSCLGNGDNDRCRVPLLTQDGLKIAREVVAEHERKKNERG